MWDLSELAATRAATQGRTPHLRSSGPSSGEPETEVSSLLVGSLLRRPCLPRVPGPPKNQLAASTAASTAALKALSSMLRGLYQLVTPGSSVRFPEDSPWPLEVIVTG